jgi:hypothetical protein
MDFVLSRKTGSDMYGFCPLFQSLVIGNLRVSIQASRTHFSSPQADFSNSDLYSEFEVALLTLRDGKWFHPEKDKRFAQTEWAKYYWKDYDDVAAYVPRHLVAQMITDLRLDAASRRKRMKPIAKK